MSLKEIARGGNSFNPMPGKGFSLEELRMIAALPGVPQEFRQSVAAEGPRQTQTTAATINYKTAL